MSIDLFKPLSLLSGAAVRMEAPLTLDGVN